MRPICSFAFLLLLLGTLSGCSIPSEPSQEGKAKITLKLDVPLSSQGFVGFSDDIKIDIYAGDSSQPIENLNWITYPNKTVFLPINQTYRFETRISNRGALLAWGQVSQLIKEDQTLSLPFRTLTQKAQLGLPTFYPSSNKLSIPLEVLSAALPSGYRTPVTLGDFEDPIYTVSGGRVLAQSKRGIEIAPDQADRPVKVSVTVRGLIHPGEEGSVDGTLELTPQSLLSGDGLDLPVQLGHSGFLVYDLVIKGYTSDNKHPELARKMIFSSIPTGPIHLPSGEELAQKGLLQPIRYVDSGSYENTGLGCTFNKPAEFLGLEASASLEAYPDTSYSVYFAAEPPTYDQATSSMVTSGEEQSLIFSNKAVEVSGGCYGAFGANYHEYKLSLKPGWNWLYTTWHSREMSGYTLTASFTPSSEPGRQYWYTLVTDSSVGLAIYPLHPALDEGFSYTVTLRPGSIYGLYRPTHITGKLSFDPQLTQPTASTGYQGTNQAGSCTWSLEASSKDTVQFSCSLNTAKPFDLSIPMTALKTPEIAKASVWIKRESNYDRVIDPDYANNRTDLAFTAGSAAVPVLLDTQAPALNIGSSLDSFTALKPSVVSGTAQDISGIQKVELYEGYQLLGMASLSSTLEADGIWKAIWKLEWTPGSTGDHLLTLAAYDGNNNVSQFSFSAPVK